MRRFWAKKCRRDHLRSLWRSVVLVTVRRCQRSAAAEGRWGSLTKCGVTKLVTVHRVYDGPSCRFVMKFREVIPVPIFQELKYFGMRPTTDCCFCDGPSDLPTRVWREQQKKLHKYGTTESMTVRRDHDGPSCGPLTQPVLADFQQLESCLIRFFFK